MAKNLVIVESPAKAKTIQKYLGKDFEVKSSFGHIRDLPSKGMSVDIDDNFKPQYQITPDKKKIVSELKSEAKKAQTVWLASDEDREGEAIAWHLLKALDLNDDQYKRIVFSEITKTAIQNAVANPRKVDKNLVDAQQARRILDRLVGYELSPILWKKIKRGLSAGRVQSVAVRLIVEREREIQKFRPSSNFKVTADFKEGFSAELNKRPSGAEVVKDFYKKQEGFDYKITRVSKTPGTRSPSAPFTTSTLQQEASRRLGYSVKQTMTLAQRLYEAGHITYMRTDSANLSSFAVSQIEELVKKEYGSEYFKSRTYKTRTQSAQEAHEAIRPTSFDVKAAGADHRQKKLYELIWQRAVASQMAAAQIAKTTFDIDMFDNYRFMAKGEIIKFKGWMEVYPNSFKELELPKAEEGDSLTLEQIVARQTFSKPAGRYNEASLVRKLEELGIGRPSTYAPTISTIQDRGYVDKGDSEGEEREVTVLTYHDSKVDEQNETEKFGSDQNKLIPTDIALVVTDFLVEHFKDVVDYDFTAEVENEFDHIAAGKVEWQKVLQEFYSDFHDKVEKAEDIKRESTGAQRELGLDPKDKKPVIARIGRYGPMLQKGKATDDEKPIFAPMPPSERIETVTLEQALEMFKLPRILGEDKDGNEISANIGRFGPYVKINRTFVSLKDKDPHTVTLDEALELIKLKEEEKKAANIKEFAGGIKVIKGRYGPYVTDGKKNAKIPKDTEPSEITEKQAKEMLKKAPARRSKRRKK